MSSKFQLIISYQSQPYNVCFYVFGKLPAMNLHKNKYSVCETNCDIVYYQKHSA